MPNKRYIGNNRQNYQVTVNLPENKGQVTITFNSGYGLRPESFFLTSDEYVQAALEQDKRFNRSYRLAEIDNVPLAEYMAKKAIAGKKETASKITTEEVLTNDNQKPEVKTFANFLAAKSWLCKNYTAVYSELNSKEVLAAKYAEAGLELKIEKT